MSDLLDFVEDLNTQEYTPPPVNRWKHLEDMVKAETDPLALFLLTPGQDLEEQVKYCDYLLWRYLSYEAKLLQFIEEQEDAAAKYEKQYVVDKCNETDPVTGKYYSVAYAQRLADTQRVPLEHRANALSTKRKLRLVQSYIRSLLSKSSKLPGRQGQANQHLRLSMDI